LQQVRDATAWIEVRNGAFLTSLNYGWLVDGAAAQSNEVEARRHAARLFIRARQRDRLGEAMGCRALAVLAARRGAQSLVDRYLRQATRVAAVRDSPHESAVTDLVRAEIELRRGSRGTARASLDRASVAFEAMQMRWHLARARRLRRDL
jgi:hypothetical protein